MLLSRKCGYNSNSGYGRGRGNLKEVVFEVGPVVILGEMIVGRELERIQGLGNNLDQEKEE